MSSLYRFFVGPSLIFDPHFFARRTAYGGRMAIFYRQLAIVNDAPFRPRRIRSCE
jgi:hypothetical protein